MFCCSFCSLSLDRAGCAVPFRSALSSLLLLFLLLLFIVCVATVQLDVSPPILLSPILLYIKFLCLQSESAEYEGRGIGNCRRIENASLVETHLKVQHANAQQTQQTRSSGNRRSKTKTARPKSQPSRNKQESANKRFFFCMHTAGSPLTTLQMRQASYH